jgi:hypothetical protein
VRGAINKRSEVAAINRTQTQCKINNNNNNNNNNSDDDDDNNNNNDDLVK